MAYFIQADFTKTIQLFTYKLYKKQHNTRDSHPAPQNPKLQVVSNLNTNSALQQSYT